ncbi:MAG: flagellar biosynthetic protein FliO [Faecalibacterium sp.]|jgi:flagellar biogenesis protein FliO|nr:flagellar biosynthetic protein FliO [Faecalibacterium sp.]
MEMLWAVLSMLGMIALMIAIFAGAYYVTRFLGSRYGAPGVSGGKIRVLDQAATGKEERLLIVRVADKVYLLAAGPAGTTKLDELDPALFPDTPVQPAAGADNFLQVLQTAIHRQHSGTAGGNTAT